MNRKKIFSLETMIDKNLDNNSIWAKEFLKSIHERYKDTDVEIKIAEELLKNEQKQLIKEYLKDSKKAFNSTHIKYETKDLKSKTEAVTEDELLEALNSLN